MMTIKIFETVFAVSCILGLAISIDQYIHAYFYAAIALALISVPLLYLLGSRYLKKGSSTSLNHTSYSAFVGLGSLILAYALYSGGAETMAVIGFVIMICWLIYLRWNVSLVASKH